MELLFFEVVDSHESILTGNGYVLGVGGEGKAIDGSVANRPAKEEGEFVLAFNGRDDCIL